MTEFEFGGLRFRSLQRQDLPVLLEWRNDEHVRRHFLKSELITLDEHQAWFEACERDPTDEVFLVEDPSAIVKPVGSAALYRPEGKQVTFGRMVVDPVRNGRRYGSRIVLGLTHYAFLVKDFDRVVLTVRPENYRAQRLYQSMGFHFSRYGDGDEPHEMACDNGRRSWERWDTGTATADITRAWTDSGEQAHRDALAKFVLAQDPSWILEVGCGSGEVAKALGRTGFNLQTYSGVDTSRKMLAEALRTMPKLDWSIGDIYDLAGRNADTVICCEVLGHLPDLSRAVYNLLNAAKRKLVLSLWLDKTARSSNEQWGAANFLHQVWSEDDLARELKGERWSVIYRSGHGTVVVVDR